MDVIIDPNTVDQRTCPKCAKPMQVTAATEHGSTWECECGQVVEQFFRTPLREELT